MLNVAVIRSVAYYLDQVAHSRADYYLGRGEAPGRWMGSLAGAFALAGRVEPAALRSLLDGRHPTTGEDLLPGRPTSPSSNPAPRSEAAVLGAKAAAEALGVSTRTLRRWAAAGREAWRGAQQATPHRELCTPAEVLARLAELEGNGGPARSRTLLLVAPGTPGQRIEIPRVEVERLREKHRAPATRQGYDLVFRPAKGYSVLWALGPTKVRSAIMAIHHQAVGDALAYLEATSANTRTTVRYGGQRTRIKARGEGLVVAAFDHRESRAGDPLIHTHCLVGNVTRLPGGRLGALEPSMLFRQQRAADAVYQATFRHLAEARLGIASVPGPAAFPEPQGVPEEVVRHFSKRSDEIAEEVERLGSRSAATRQLAALNTRRAKEVAARTEDLLARWRSEAAALGFGEERVIACLSRTGAREVGGDALAEVFAHLAGPEGLTARAATFTRAEVIRALADRLSGTCSGPRLVDLANAFLATDAVIQVRERRPGQPRGRVLEDGRVVDDLSAARFSVPELASIESRLMEVANEKGGPVLAPPVIDTALLSHPHLSDEQARMVRSVCSATTLLRPVVGLPGSGKTTATAALVGALQSAGVPVLGCAVTATAAAELARASGLSACDTLARTLIDLEAGGPGLRPGTVVVADEASTLPHRDLDCLLDRVRGAGGALVLVGDPHQHGSVGPGSFFAWLVAKRGDAAPTLAANLRQTDQLDEAGAPVISLAAEREAASAMRQGQISDSLHLREEAGLLVRRDTPAELHTQLVEDWATASKDTSDPMVVASNATRERLNHLSRSLLQDAGALSGSPLLVGDRQFQVGDWVVARRNHRRLRSPTDQTWWVRNGASGRVGGVDRKRATLLVDFAAEGGKAHRVLLPRSYVARHVEHSYALTDYAVQGRTLTRSLSVLEGASTAPGTYVATTRGRLENRLYVADGETLDPAGLDVSHGPPTTRQINLVGVAARLDARRPEVMLHDRDPLAQPASQLAGSRSTAELEGEAGRLSALLDDEPPDPARSLASTRRALESLAQRREALLAELSQPGAGRAPNPDGSSLSGELSALEARQRHLQSVGERLERRATVHDEWSSRRESRVGRRALVTDALAMRKVKERFGLERAGNR